MPVSRESRTRSRLTRLIDVQALVLHLEEEIVLAENVPELMRVGARLIVTAFDQRFRHRAAQAGGERDQAAAVLRQQVVVDARLVVEAFEKAGGNQLDQVAVAFGILAEQHQVVGVALAGLGRSRRARPDAPASLPRS